ncbi:3-oxoacyl-[acyl-carrier-protein] reductase [Gammaproteobacteria bacterium]|jgi:3-oxoacyl-[acyl-carrier protein] reductase|nr:3-oxoacyl-[acyl-carrier-protein] reductase [Gammaproteobacteria bacterium]MDB3867485.1 3-oxoacyl-[acyl-carrier-protein] reductase [Gammaproteobacteria bacterium]MDC0441091.1 3-oxoacyl-[acyl-carrier-protein] reductase [Gammaproteobacteria bacterium]MDC0914807.1 3-oxoacyl-[acyl-carrier-protein] reductase [Gammaproteobacteria bacterium]|tara:strand:- start:22 stop:744 length:723 start_codon:yes stop_codon:yes gene_type:complete
MDKKIVFITGVSRGIGLEIAKCFSNNGYFVLGTSRSDFDLAKVLSSDECLHLQLDVTDRNQVSACLDQLKEIDKVPNVLINNAGITKDQLFLRMKNEDWDDVIDTNLTSVFNMSKLFIKSMVKERSGSIINISSVAGLMGNAGQVNYSASKAGLGGFTRALAKEVAARNITVNCIAPGFIETDMTDHFQDKDLENILNQIPANKMGNPQHIADLALFLASPKGNYITGQTISVDGGLFMS